MLDKNLIIKKLSLIEGYIKELEPIIVLEDKEILDNTEKVHTAERLFQLLVDTMTDINTHIIRNHILPPPDDLQSTFISLGEAEILPKDFALKLAPIVGLRNGIVHRYDSISTKRFIQELKTNFDDFKRYAVIISEKFLGK